MQISLLDRLSNEGLSKPGAYIDQEYRISLFVKHLETIFNTRQTSYLTIKDETIIDHSVILSYGLPDLSHFNPNVDNDKKKLLTYIEKTILTHEPRLKNVKVEYSDAINPSDISLRITIEATLADQNEILLFNIELNSATGKFKFEER